MWRLHRTIDSSFFVLLHTVQLCMVYSRLTHSAESRPPPSRPLIHSDPTRLLGKHLSSAQRQSSLAGRFPAHAVLRFRLERRLRPRVVHLLAPRGLMIDVRELPWTPQGSIQPDIHARYGASDPDIRSDPSQVRYSYLFLDVVSWRNRIYSSWPRKDSAHNGFK
jgi:hypothetical protein